MNITEEAPKKKAEKMFDYDYVMDLAQRYQDEGSEFRQAAFLNRVGKQNHLSVMEKEPFSQNDINFTAYLFPDTPEIYEAMDELADSNMRDAMCESAFACAWSAMIEVLGPYQILSEVAEF